MKTWFPRPDASEAIHVLTQEGMISSGRIFELLTSPHSREWRERVGVRSPGDGSAKRSARLLLTGDQVIKTDTHLQYPDREAAAASVQPRLELAERLALWHPQKTWFLMCSEARWWVLSVCPRLKTLRQFRDRERKMRAWLDMLRFTLKFSQHHRVGLDLNPSNFGLEQEANDLFYLDDETYMPLSMADWATAVVIRISEEPEIPSEVWSRWGERVGRVFLEFLTEQDLKGELFSQVRDFHLAPIFKDKQKALAQGILAATKPRRRGPAPPKRTLIFSDVHGNWPALRQVLAAGADCQVDSYLFLGDVVGYGAFPKECIRATRELPNAVLLRGNHDHIVGTGTIDQDANRWARHTHAWTIDVLDREEREWLLSLQTEYQEDLWLAVHGAPIDKHRFFSYVYEMTYRDNLDYLQKHGLRLCFYGHTHVVFMFREKDDGNSRVEKEVPNTVNILKTGERMLLNPGSVGQPRDGDCDAAFAIWEREKQTISFHRVNYPLMEIIEANQRQGFPEELNFRLESGR